MAEEKKKPDDGKEPEQEKKPDDSPEEKKEEIPGDFKGKPG